MINTGGRHIHEVAHIRQLVLSLLAGVTYIHARHDCLRIYRPAGKYNARNTSTLSLDQSFPRGALPDNTLSAECTAPGAMALAEN